jgi:hypothetical protein
VANLSCPYHIHLKSTGNSHLFNRIHFSHALTCLIPVT